MSIYTDQKFYLGDDVGDDGVSLHWVHIGLMSTGKLCKCRFYWVLSCRRLSLSKIIWRCGQSNAAVCENMQLCSVCYRQLWCHNVLRACVMQQC